MFTGVFQSVVTLLLAVAFYGQDVWLIHRYDPDRAEGTARSWSWTAFAIIMATIVILQPMVWPGTGWYVDAWWGLVLQLVGLTLMLAGLVLHWWARVHLRQFFGERIEYQPGQYLVDSGPYAYVRHPIYTAFYLCVMGLLLVNPALTTVIVTVYFFWDFGRAAREEEALLANRLPGYEEYMARTPRYLPALGQFLGTRGSGTHGRRHLPEPDNQ